MLSLKSGHVFERSIILRQINETGQCPLTGADLLEADLQDIQVAKVAQPRLAEVNSVPAAIGMLQAEWDSQVLESYQIRKRLDDTRKELAHALYQHEAACRVIARLIKEKEEQDKELRLLREEVEELRGN